MSWLYNPRLSFTHVSTHQTYVGKALFEHAPNCATIAAVACMSSSLLKSSLGPNLLALIRVQDITFDLFDKIFLEYNPHMQLTQKLVVESYVDPEVATVFIKKLKSNGPLFSSSLQHAEIHSECLSLFKKFRVLRSLSLSNVEQCEQLSAWKSLPSLSELKLTGCSDFDAAFFKALGDLENNRNFTSLDFSWMTIASECFEGFHEDFCCRLLSKNRLTKLEFSWNIWESMNEEDEEAFVNTAMTNLVELRNVPSKLIRGDGFGNLRILKVFDASDEDLVNIGNHCLFLEVLEAGGGTSGSFLNDRNLDHDAFKQLRELKINASNFSHSDVFGTGCSRLVALAQLVITTFLSFDGSFLQHLPNPDRLRSVSIIRTIFIENRNFSINNLHRFVNLEEIAIGQFHLSRGDILSFTRFKQLKRLSLSDCGEQVAFSEPFRILCCAELPNLEKLCCYGNEASRWTEEDVDAILVECKRLRELVFAFKGDGHNMTRLKMKYPWVSVHGKFQKEPTTDQESGSRREREE